MYSASDWQALSMTLTLNLIVTLPTTFDALGLAHQKFLR